MKKSPLKRGTKQLKRSGFKKKVKKSARSKKMEVKKSIIEQYELPSLQCKRWGTTKGATRTDILRGLLWNVFSRYIRQRDDGRCISCGRPFNYDNLQAGHYIPVGGSSIELWFNEKNVNGECEHCNAWDSYHLIPMRKNLIVKWGEIEVLTLEDMREKNVPIKWDETDYIQRIKYYYNKLKNI